MRTARVGYSCACEADAYTLKTSTTHASQLPGAVPSFRKNLIQPPA
jgi:hypothetical protein